MAVIRINKMTTLQEAITKYRRVHSGDIGVLRDIAATITEQMVQKMLDELKPALIKEVKDSILQEIYHLRTTVKKGDDGKTPTKEDLLTLIYPLIPKIKNGNDGKTPTKEELTALMRPLIPKIKNGKDADEQKIVQNVLTQIKMPEQKEIILDTPQQMADKINTLDEKIEQHTIKGLAIFMQSIQSAVRETRQQKTTQRGGGMGNIQEQQFALTTGTASVQTTYPISQEGRGILKMLADQAELMRKHYTVGSDRRTITFNNEIRRDFVENGELYISYIRG